MKVHLYQYLPHKPYGQRLPHHQNDIFINTTVSQIKVIKMGGNNHTKKKKTNHNHTLKLSPCK